MPPLKKPLVPPPAAPVPVEAPVLVVARGTRVSGLDPKTGQALWNAEIPGGGSGPVEIAIEGGVVFASASGDRLVALDYRTGRSLWEASVGAQGRAAIVVDSGRVFVHKGGRLTCLGASGQRLWVQEVRAPGVKDMTLAVPGRSRCVDEGSGRPSRLEEEG